MKNKFYTIKDFAKIIGVSVPFIYLEINRGKLKAEKLANNRKIIFESEMIRYLTEKNVTIL